MWLVGGLWIRTVCQSDQTMGGKRTDTAVGHTSGFGEGQRVKTTKYVHD